MLRPSFHYVPAFHRPLEDFKRDFFRRRRQIQGNRRRIFHFSPVRVFFFPDAGSGQIFQSLSPGFTVFDQVKSHVKV